MRSYCHEKCHEKLLPREATATRSYCHEKLLPREGRNSVTYVLSRKSNGQNMKVVKAVSVSRPNHKMFSQTGAYWD
ncbi:hypothetical protein LSAT2_015290 [Lamellibrachia satsuma]|nr:hypothetical protein LSAT2_015290 [Lamellibrachia satsuma]